MGLRQMFNISAVRQAMMNWNRFITACFLVAAALIKAGVPLMAVVLGVASAALLNWQLRPRHV